MARAMAASKVLDLAHLYFPSFLSQREHVEALDSWHRGEQDENTGPGGTRLGKPYQPETVTDEYTDLMHRSPTPWLQLVTRALVQNAELVGIRSKGSSENLQAWLSWQRNRMDGKQRALYTASSAHGLAFASAMRGKDPLTGSVMSKFDIISARKMAAFYDEEDDEWPMFAIRAEPEFSEKISVQTGWLVRLIDEVAVHYLHCKGDGWQRSDWTYISYEEHGAKVPPIVRYAPSLDIDGRANSDIAPLIPLAARIDQDTFDRLIVQRFGAWKIRYIAGLAKPKTGDPQAEKMRLRVEDLLISEDWNTKFGTLDASDIKQFIEARDADLRDMSAVSQTPPHHLLGLSANMQAESLAAAEAGLQRKSREHRISWGESHEQLFRLDAHLRGDRAEMNAYDMEVRWRDTESRSLEQAAMSLGMLATNLKVPVEMLWERIPGWTDSDVLRAKELITSGENVDAFLEELEKIANETRTQPDREPVNAG